MAHLQQQKNSALEQCSLAKVEVLHVYVTIRRYMCGKAWNIFSNNYKILGGGSKCVSSYKTIVSTA